MPLPVVASLALLGVSLALGAFKYKKQRRELKRRQKELADARAIESSITDAGASIPILYGYTSINLITAYANAADSIAEVVSGTSTINGTLPIGTGENNEYLLAQYIVSVDELEDVSALFVGGDNITVGKLQRLTSARWDNGHPDTVPPSVVTSFNSERGENTKFSYLSYVSLIAKHDRNDPQFSDIPFLRAMVQGRKCRGISATDGLAETRAFTTNPASILLDFMIGAEAGERGRLFGPAIPIADIDAASFESAIEAAGEEVQGPNNASFLNRPFPTGSEIREQVTAGLTTWSEYLTSIGINTSDTGNLDLGFWNNTVAVNRYDFNGVLPSDRNDAQSLETILEVMPGALLFTSLEGKWKIALPNPYDAAMNQSVTTINDNDLLRAPDYFLPDNSTRLNSYTVTFRDRNRGFENNTVTYPIPGSTVASYFEGKDNGRFLSGGETIEGCNNQYNATAIARSHVWISRRARFRFSMLFRGVILEPGDVVFLNSKFMDFYPEGGGEVGTAYVRIEKLVVDTSNLTIEVEGIEFNPNDYVWQSYQNASDQIGSFDPNNTTRPTVLPIEGVEVDDITVDSFKVEWEEWVTPPGSHSGYKVFVGWPSGVEAHDIGKVTELELTGRIANTPYTIRVAGLYEYDGEIVAGPFSQPIVATTLAAGGVNLGVLAPSALAASSVSYDNFTASWSALATTPAGFSGYRLLLSKDNEVTETDTTSTSLPVTNLEDDTAYEIQVATLYTVNGEVQRSGYSSPITVQTLRYGEAVPVTGLRSSSITATGFATSWSAWSPPTGTTHTGYVVALSGEGSEALNNVNTSTTTLTFSSLTRGGSYNITVRGKYTEDGIAKVSPNSAALAVQLVIPPLPDPDLVTGLSVSGVTTNSFTVGWSHWTPPVGGTRTGYTVTLSGEGSETFHNVTSTTTSRSFSGLVTGGVYAVSVRASYTIGGVTRRGPNSAAQAVQLIIPPPDDNPSG